MIIRNKPKGARIVWDVEKGKPLLTFKGGSFETSDENVARKAKALGYEVEGITEEEKPKRAKKTEKEGK